MRNEASELPAAQCSASLPRNKGRGTAQQRENVGSPRLGVKIQASSLTRNPCAYAALIDAQSAPWR